MLVSKDLSYAYNQSNVLTFPDISLQKCDQCLLLGRSGSGKTTLLNLLSGMRTPRTGSILIGNTDLARLPASKLDRFRGKHIGIVFQQSHFVRSLNVSENLALAQSLARVKVDRERINTLLKRLNLSDKLYARTSALSVGEQQRVAIARALVNFPDVMMADEPTSALDDDNTHEVLDLLQEEAKRANATLLIVTHDHRLKEKIKLTIELDSEPATSSASGNN